MKGAGFLVGLLALAGASCDTFPSERQQFTYVVDVGEAAGCYFLEGTTSSVVATTDSLVYVGLQYRSDVSILLAGVDSLIHQFDIVESFHVTRYDSNPSAVGALVSVRRLGHSGWIARDTSRPTLLTNTPPAATAIFLTDGGLVTRIMLDLPEWVFHWFDSELDVDVPPREKLVLSKGVCN